MKLPGLTPMVSYETQELLLTSISLRASVDRIKNPVMNRVDSHYQPQNIDISVLLLLLLHLYSIGGNANTLSSGRFSPTILSTTNGG